MKTVTIAAPKGGSGKTTTALLLAVLARQKKLRVAMFDLNADQGNVPQWQASRGDLAGPTLIDVENIVRDAKIVASKFDLLIVDTPPVIDDTEIVEACVAIADYVLIPVRPSILDIGAMPAIVEICRERRKPFAFMLCDVTATWRSLNSKAAAALEEMGPVMTARLSHRMAYVNALTIGKVGPEIDADCRAEAAALWVELQRNLGKV
jgi:chromosome partitioning protein